MSHSHFGTPLHFALVGLNIMSPSSNVRRDDPRLNRDSVEWVRNFERPTSGPSSPDSDVSEYFSFSSPHYRVSGLSELDNVPLTIDVLLQCGASARSLYSKESAAYMALDWSKHQDQSRLFLPFIRHRTLVPDDAVELFEEIASDFTGKYQRFHSRGQEALPRFLIEIVDELLSNNNDEASPSEQFSRMRSTAQMLTIIFEQRGCGHAGIQPSTMTEHDFYQTLSLAVKNDRHLDVAGLITDQRFHADKLLLWHGGTIVHAAAHYCSENVLKLVLERGFDVELEDEDGFTPLPLCYRKDQITVIELLLKANADSTKSNHHGCSIWHYAARLNSICVLESLIQFDIRKEVALKATSEHRTPIAEALHCGNKESAEILLDACQDIACLSSDIPVLHYAARIGSERLFRQLLDMGVDPLQRSSDNKTPLHNVGLNAEPRFITYLASIYDIHERANNGSFAFMEVLSTLKPYSPSISPARINTELGCLLDKEIVKTLFDEGADIWSHIFHTVMERTNYSHGFGIAVDFTRMLVETEILSSYEDCSGNSAAIPVFRTLIQITNVDLNPYRLNLVLQLILNATIHLETIKSHPLSVELLNVFMTNKIYDGVEYLLSEGIGVHASAASQVSALQWACTIDLPTKSFLTLVDNVEESKLGSISPFGNSLVNSLVRNLETGDKILKLSALLAKGADPNITEDEGNCRPAIVIAAMHGQFDVVSLLLDHGGDPNASDLEGNNIIEAACFYGNLQTVQRIGEGLQLNCNWLQVFGLLKEDPLTRGDRFNYLHIASSEGHNNVVEYFLEHNLISVDTVSTMNQITSLHLAVLRNRHETVEVLLRRGANINAKDYKNHIPLDWALITGNLDMARLLLLRRSDMGNGTNWTEYQTKELLRDSSRDVTEEGPKHAQIFLESSILRGDLYQCKRIVETTRMDLSTTTMPSCRYCSPLVYAISRSSHPDVLRWLLSNGASLHKVSCTKGHVPRRITPLSLVADPDVLRELLDHAIVTAIPWIKDSLTPLHVATYRNDQTNLNVILLHIKRHLNLYRYAYYIPYPVISIFRKS